MVDMEVLNEPELMNNLSKRLTEGIIYTYVGSSLVIMNPYCKLDVSKINLLKLFSLKKFLWNTKLKSHHLILV